MYRAVLIVMALGKLKVRADKLALNSFDQTIESRRQHSALSLPEVEEALREITDSHNLGIYLGVPPENLERFERDFPRDTIRQRTETITYWLRNCANATWERLAAAVERLGRHGNLVRRLRELAQQSSQNGADPGKQFYSLVSHTLQS